MALTTHPARKGRFNLRATKAQRILIVKVAQRQGISVTDFILRSACAQAEQLLADRVHLSVPSGRWKAFLDALDRPAQAKPRLKRLFSGPATVENQ